MFLFFYIFLFQKVFSNENNGSEFFFSNENLTHEEAVNACIDMGMDLLYIHDKENLNEIKEIFQNNEYLSMEEFWISSFGIPKNNDLLQPWISIIYNYYIDNNGEIIDSFFITYYQQKSFYNKYICYKKPLPATATIQITERVPITQSQDLTYENKLTNVSPYEAISVTIQLTKTIPRLVFETKDPKGVYLTMTQTIVNPRIIKVTAM